MPDLPLQIPVGYLATFLFIGAIVVAAGRQIYLWFKGDEGSVPSEE